MTQTLHPNLSLLSQIDLQDLDGCQQIFSSEFVWHYFNPQLVELAGDYIGIGGLKSFFAQLGAKTANSFQVNVVDSRTAGDELVVTQVCNSMNYDDQAVEFDAVVVWRIVNNKIMEAWDIPAVYTLRAAAHAE